MDKCVPEWEFPCDFGEDGNLDNLIARKAREFAESENFKNETIGEARAIQEQSFRNAILNGKTEKNRKTGKYFWITINPRKDIKLPAIVAAVENVYKKKWIGKYAYVFETTEKEHQHSHGLIYAEYEPGRAHKEIGNTIKHICDITNVACFKFVVIDEEKAKQKMEYMLGKKKPKKQKGVQITLEWRKLNKLSDIYTSESPILLDSRK